MLLQKQWPLGLEDTGEPPFADDPMYFPEPFKPFGGEVTHVEFETRTFVVQDIRPVDSPLSVIRVGYFPRYGLDGRIRVLTRSWQKKIRKLGVHRDHMRHISGLSKRMCKARLDENVSRKRTKKWIRRYEEEFKPYLRFRKPSLETYVEMTLTLRLPPPRENLFVDVVLVYEPTADRVEVMRFGKGGSWKALGLTGPARVSKIDEFKRNARRYFHNYLTRDWVKEQEND